MGIAKQKRSLFGGRFSRSGSCSTAARNLDPRTCQVGKTTFAIYRKITAASFFKERKDQNIPIGSTLTFESMHRTKRHLILL